jgi:dihydropteroate synthase
MVRSPPRSRQAALAKYRARVLEVTSAADVARELERTDSDPEGVGIMTRKGRTLLVRVEDVPLKAAPLLKQEMLALGADASHARGVADLSVVTSPVVLIATPGQYQRLLPKLRRQPFRLREIADAVESALDHYGSRSARTLRGLHRTVPLGDRTRVMGVLNLTPDSFYDGGRYDRPETAVERAEAMVQEGASLIDVGAESTRPGSSGISAEQELERLRPVLGRLHDRLQVPISVDTRKPEVARAALEIGADLINDVGGLREPEMRRLLVRSGAPVVVMHMRGTPETMQQDLIYADLRGEVYAYLTTQTELARTEGVASEQMLIDPGPGFGKSAEQSLELLRHLGELRSLGYPLVVGASRKSFLGRLLEDAPAEERGEASLAAAVVAGLQGAALVRAHDVRATVRALAVADAVRLGRLEPSAAARPGASRSP